MFGDNFGFLGSGVAWFCACCASRVFLGLESLRRKFGVRVVSAAVWVSIVAGVVVLSVAICAGGDVVVGQVLLLVVAVFLLLVLLWLRGVLMSVLRPPVLVSFAGVLVAVLLCGM